MEPERIITSLDELISFLRQFHRDVVPVPFDRAALSSELPKTLRELYGALGDLIAVRPGPFASQDALAPPSELLVENNAVVFAYENSGDWECWCPIDAPFPPVYWNGAFYFDKTAPPDEVRQVTESLERFLITFCLREAVMSCADVTEERYGTPILPHYAPLYLRGDFLWGTIDFYYSSEDDALLMESRQEGQWIGRRVDRFSISELDD